jgi:hypothetical protein
VVHEQEETLAKHTAAKLEKAQAEKRTAKAAADPVRVYDDHEIVRHDVEPENDTTVRRRISQDELEALSASMTGVSLSQN